MRFRNKLFFIAIVALGFASCKKWDDHIEVANQDLSQNLSQAIAANSNLSTFSSYIKQAGVDTILQSSKTFTVWAPTNAALQGLDPAIVNDKAKLRSFVLNHISNQSYFTRDLQTTIRIAMLSGKYNNAGGGKFEDANITSSDKFVSNGVLHTIDKAVLVLPNLWEFISSTASQYAQNAYLASLNYTDFDPTLAIVDSISATTGLPVYKPGTGFVVKNKFNDRVFDLRREDKQYTYFVIADANFKVEADSLLKYYATGNNTSTDSLAKWFTTRDLVVEGLYPAAALNNLVSKYGVAIPVSAANITQTIKVSNGLVHVVSKLDIPTVSKFKEIKIEGENPSGFSRDDKRGNTNYRIKLDSLGQVFSDLMVSGHAVTGFYAYYRLSEIPSIKYKMYVRGVNDFQTAAFPQRLETYLYSPPSTYTQLASFVHNVPLSSTGASAYNEVYLGDVTVTNFGTLEIRLVAQNTPSGTAAPVAGTNPIVLDYIRLVPQP